MYFSSIPSKFSIRNETIITHACINHVFSKFTHEMPIEQLHEHLRMCIELPKKVAETNLGTSDPVPK
jgi:hypothetical protein